MAIPDEIPRTANCRTARMAPLEFALAILAMIWQLPAAIS
jgi:hypothetical protein